MSKGTGVKKDELCDSLVEFKKHVLDSNKSFIRLII